MNFFHTGAKGDLIYSLIAVRALGGGAIWLPSSSSDYAAPAPSNLAFREPCRLLLEMQPYVEMVGAAESTAEIPEPREPLVDFGAWDHSNHLAVSQCKHAGVEFPGFDPWLTAEPVNPFGEPFALVNVTHRYRSRVDWRRTLAAEPLHKAFIGYRDEHENFERDYGQIEWFPADNLWEVACLIAASEKLYGNPSVCVAIAQGLGHRYACEWTHGGMFTETPNEELIG